MSNAVEKKKYEVPSAKPIKHYGVNTIVVHPLLARVKSPEKPQPNYSAQNMDTTKDD